MLLIVETLLKVCGHIVVGVMLLIWDEEQIKRWAKRVASRKEH